MQVTQANVSGGLAAAAVLCMGEGDEQTPLAIISEAGFMKFRPYNPTEEELDELHMSLRDDLFAPFLENVPWNDGASGRQ